MIGFVVALAIATQPYNWKSVQMVGGGFVDGIVFNPSARGVCYARTDIGGAYRRIPRNGRWEPLLDWVSYKDTNLMGVESIALDPRDPNRVYLACGTYTNPTTPNGAILRSTDRGRTFERTEMPFKMGGNENGRGNGERLGVDPLAPNVLYFGSRNAGLWKSGDYAKTWGQVIDFPGGGVGGVGIVSVLFDPRGAHAQTGTPSDRMKASVVYVAVSTSGRSNIYRSLDGGSTWEGLPNEPIDLRPTRMALGSDGTLYVTYGSSAGPTPMRDGAVWKLDTRSGQWTDITPDKPTAERRFGYAAVSVQKDNPRVVIASTFYHPGGEEIFRSTDGGGTWRPLMHTAVYDFSLAPYVARTPIHWLFDLEIDPFNSNHALFTTGYGGYETFNLSDADRGRPTKWRVMSTGIEETVPLHLLSPPSGAHLISAIGDYGGFVHWNLDRPAADGNFTNPTFGNTTGAAFAQRDPRVIVRVGRAAGSSRLGNIGYSLDGGHTWQPAKAPYPGAGSGQVAVSAPGGVWIWTPAGGVPERTDDRGDIWARLESLPVNARVIADPVNGTVFYSLDLFGGRLFVSRDGGRTFEATAFELPGGLPIRGGNRGDVRGGQDQLYAAPGREGDLWIAAFDGLYHRASGHFLKIEGVQEIHAFGFGKPAPESSDPALYLAGTIEGVDGIFRSDNYGKTWVRINDGRHRYALILQVSGDPRVYGRIYVGIHGRGVVYGEPR